MPGSSTKNDGDSGRRGKIEGHEAVFKIDTGAGGGTIAVHAPTVERLGLLEGRETSAAMSGGVGGMGAVRAGKLDTLDFAGRRFERLLRQWLL